MWRKVSRWPNLNQLALYIDYLWNMSVITALPASTDYNSYVKERKEHQYKLHWPTKCSLFTVMYIFTSAKPGHNIQSPLPKKSCTKERGIFLRLSGLNQVIKQIPALSESSFYGTDSVLVELLGEDEVGGGAGDGDEAADGGCVRDAQRQALADHVVSVGGVLWIPPDLGFLWQSRDADWSLFGNKWDKWF